MMNRRHAVLPTGAQRRTILGKTVLLLAIAIAVAVTVGRTPVVLPCLVLFGTVCAAAVCWEGVERSITLYREVHQIYSQTEASLQLQHLLQPRYPLPPLRGWAVSPDFALRLACTILDSRPATILELGSGASTLVSAYCLERLGRGRVISLDQDQHCADTTTANLQRHGLAALATVIHAPLATNDPASGGYTWYSPFAIQNLPRIDLLIVDGPAVKTREGRYPSLPILREYLSDNAVILMDDCDRKSERAIVAEWLDEFKEFRCERFPDEKGTVVFRRRTPEGRLSADTDSRPQ
jgi:hypothetical protein